MVRLSTGVACLHAFIQGNWTGPDLDILPSKVIQYSSEVLGQISEESLNGKAIAELAYGGEPAYHLADGAAFLRFAQFLFSLPYQHCQTAAWWKLRASSVHQDVLDEPVFLSSAIQSSVEPLFSSLSSLPDLDGSLALEIGLLEHRYGHDKVASEKFVQAAKKTGLEYELTGALGKRTKFQQTDLSQLVLLAQSRERSSQSTENNLVESAGATSAPPVDESRAVPETLALNDDTLLEQTEFTSSSSTTRESRVKHVDPSSQPPLHPLDQCIILALCLNVKNTSPSHGLTGEQMSPYVARVISHPLNWSVHTMALLLRSRLESTRTRTVERSTLQLQALVDQMPVADSAISERLLYFHSLHLPSKWEMQRELALRFLILGVVKSAMEIFEKLEMWEEVVKCWITMERRDKGIAIVRDLLEGRKEEADAVISRSKPSASHRRQILDEAREAKLWCLLGDLEPDHALDHYERAWTLSGETSGRAMRSLGGYYFARGEFSTAIPCLKKAVSINPLLSRTWFILGCSCVRTEDWNEARNAFSRCVSIDDEDGESWNNLASVYLRMDVPSDNLHQSADNAGSGDGEDDLRESSTASIPFSNKILAFRALKQGLKYSYENWRMWINYMIVAMDVGELSEACRAQARVVEERNQKIGAACVDMDVVERLVDAVTREPLNPEEAVDATSIASNPNEGHGLLPRVVDLLERTILPRVSSTRIFRAYARLLTWQERWNDVVKAYLDGYRASAAGTMEKGETNETKWRDAVDEVQDIVDILRNFGPRAVGFNWQLQARSIVRTFMGRTRDNFEDDPAWEKLMKLQEELRNEE
ncbi:TPR-like protein [Rickenella mellea]|uniref:TPR-like protein n=1 Tax=Rickenella mellea TaxID=50990 RepID=A0A4R5XG00_9AGAM|nr:TPR-like protein [Rickenella mellea]